MEKISKETAVQLGLKRFFTGVPCFRGHICERYVASSNACVECVRFTKQKQKERDPERARLCGRFYQLRQVDRDPERVRQYLRAWRARQKAKQTRRVAAEMENGPISL
jgi:hypothetical protein